jgi:hypothetical protein
LSALWIDLRSLSRGGLLIVVSMVMVFVRCPGVLRPCLVCRSEDAGRSVTALLECSIDRALVRAEQPEHVLSLGVTAARKSRL